VAARGLSYGKRRHERNPDESNGINRKKTSTGNASADGEEGRVAGRA
jgi:hypothetical protein